jgi:hypothetical protein
MPNSDEQVISILRNAPVTDADRDAAWQAYTSAADKDAFRRAFDAMQTVPREVKAQLWEAKFAGTAKVQPIRSVDPPKPPTAATPPRPTSDVKQPQMDEIDRATAGVTAPKPGVLDHITNAASDYWGVIKETGRRAVDALGTAAQTTAASEAYNRPFQGPTEEERAQAESANAKTAEIAKKPVIPLSQLAPKNPKGVVQNFVAGALNRAEQFTTPVDITAGLLAAIATPAAPAAALAIGRVGAGAMAVGATPKLIEGVKLTREGKTDDAARVFGEAGVDIAPALLGESYLAYRRASIPNLKPKKQGKQSPVQATRPLSEEPPLLEAPPRQIETPKPQREMVPAEPPRPVEPPPAAAVQGPQITDDIARQALVDMGEPVTPEGIVSIREAMEASDPADFLSPQSYQRFFGGGGSGPADLSLSGNAGSSEPQVQPAGASGTSVHHEPPRPTSDIAEPPKPSLPNTRGKGQQYHGTSNEIPDIQEYTYNDANIYGQGFYTTDAVDIAGGYTKKGKGKAPVIYRTSERTPQKLYDMEAPLDNAAMAAIAPLKSDYINGIIDGDKPKNLRELYDLIRDYSRDEGLSRDAVQELFDSIGYNLEQQGYTGLTHLGGLQSKKEPHKVKIYFNPKRDIAIEKFDPNSLSAEQPKPPQIAEPPVPPQEGSRTAGVSVSGGVPEVQAQQTPSTAQEGGSPVPAPESPALPSADASQGAVASAAPATKPTTRVQTVPTNSLSVDPVRFQFKSNVGRGGVSDKLKDDDVEWNPDMAGVISAWTDPADGKTYVINGHHRYDKAVRKGVEELDVKHIQAKDAQQARAIGALINIAEGQGTALDAAKVIRDLDWDDAALKKRGIHLRGGLAKEARSLARLAPEVFSKVASGAMDEDAGAAIGSLLSAPEDQIAAASLIERASRSGQRLTSTEVEDLIKIAQNAPKIEVQDQNFSLFGNDTEVQNLAIEQAKLAGAIRSQLAAEKRLFSTVGKESAAEKLGAAGNTIKAKDNAAIAEEAKRALEIYNKLYASAGPISRALSDGAIRIARGDNDSAVRKDVYEAVRNAVAEVLQGGNRSDTGSASRVSAGGSPEAGPRSDAVRPEPAAEPAGEVEPPSLFGADPPKPPQEPAAASADPPKPPADEPDDWSEQGVLDWAKRKAQAELKAKDDKIAALEAARPSREQEIEQALAVLPKGGPAPEEAVREAIGKVLDFENIPDQINKAASGSDWDGNRPALDLSGNGGELDDVRAKNIVYAIWTPLYRSVSDPIGSNGKLPYFLGQDPQTAIAKAKTELKDRKQVELFAALVKQVAGIYQALTGQELPQARTMIEGPKAQLSEPPKPPATKADDQPLLGGQEFASEVAAFNDSKSAALQKRQLEAELGSQLFQGDPGAALERDSPLFGGNPIDDSPAQGSLMSDVEPPKPEPPDPPKPPSPKPTKKAKADPTPPDRDVQAANAWLRDVEAGKAPAVLVSRGKPIIEKIRAANENPELLKKLEDAWARTTSPQEQLAQVRSDIEKWKAKNYQTSDRSVYVKSSQDIGNVTAINEGRRRKKIAELEAKAADLEQRIAEPPRYLKPMDSDTPTFTNRAEAADAAQYRVYKEPNAAATKKASRLYLNDAGIAIVAGALRAAGYDTGGLEGAMLYPQHLTKAAQILATRTFPDMNAHQHAKLRLLAQALTDLVDSSRAGVIVNAQGKTLARVREIVRHEQTHTSTEFHTKGKPLFDYQTASADKQFSALVNTAMDFLRKQGYAENTDTMYREMVTNVASGDFRIVGGSRDDAMNLLLGIISRVEATHGKGTAEGILTNARPAVRKEIKDTRDRLRATGPGTSMATEPPKAR